MDKHTTQLLLNNVDKAINTLQQCAYYEQFLTQSRARDSKYVQAIIVLQDKRLRIENIMKKHINTES